MNYKTYAEAKIANPDSEIFSNGEGFDAIKNSPTSHFSNAWVICNPADHCSSLKEFLEAGLALCCGDIILDESGSVNRIVSRNTLYNKPEDCDGTIFILSASALLGCRKIPAKADQWTVYSNTLPLCELTDEQVGKLVKHSGCVEHMNPNGGEWAATITPMWSRAGVYRIKPKSERELFIENTIKVMRDAGTKCPDKHEYFGIMFDAGARYKDLTQHFGENI